MLERQQEKMQEKELRRKACLEERASRVMSLDARKSRTTHGSFGLSDRSFSIQTADEQYDKMDRIVRKLKN